MKALVKKLRPTLFNLAIVIVAMLSLVNCSVFGPSKRANDENSAKSGAGKPSEEGEGVPGYLTDPTLIRISQSGASYTVSGAAGSVASKNGPLGGLLICLRAIPKATLSAFLGGQEIVPDTNTPVVAWAFPSSNGSFDLATQTTPFDDPAFLIYISRTSSCDDGNFVMPIAGTKTTIAYVEPDKNAVFQKPDNAAINETSSATKLGLTVDFPGTLPDGAQFKLFLIGDSSKSVCGVQSQVNYAGDTCNPAYAIITCVGLEKTTFNPTPACVTETVLAKQVAGYCFAQCKKESVNFSQPKVGVNVPFEIQPGSYQLLGWASNDYSIIDEKFTVKAGETVLKHLEFKK